MFKKKQEGNWSPLLGVVYLTIFLVSSIIVQAAPPVANDAVVQVSKPTGTEIELTATGGPTSYIITSLPVLGWLIDPILRSPKLPIYCRVMLWNMMSRVRTM